MSSWKKRSQLRVFICVSSRDANIDGQQKQVEKMLSELRIQATIIPVNWDPVIQHLKQEQVRKNYITLKCIWWVKFSH